jgi:hypothetical protein
MNVQQKQQTAAQKIREAETVRDELMAVLAGAGITLSSLRIDALAYGDEKPHPLIDLGRCNVPTARGLLAALRKASPPRN